MAVRLSRPRPSELPVIPLRSSDVSKMVHQDQGGVIMPLRTAPQWPPRQSMGGGQSSTQSFMARCAKAGGRSVEWPPRYEDIYGSHPVLNSSSLFSAAPGDQVAAPPVPPRPSYYPLRKAHSSAPNLFDAAQKPPRPPPVKDSRKLASKQGGQSVQEPEEDIRELISEDLPPLSTSPETTLPLEDQPQQKKQRQPPAMSSSVSSNTSSQQVRINESTSQTFQYQQPQQQHQVIKTTRVIQKQYGMTGDEGINIPVQFDPSQQQKVLQQQLQNQQQPFQQQFVPQQQQPPIHREFNVPIQISNTPPPNASNPLAQHISQTLPQQQGGVPQGMAFVPTQSSNTTGTHGTVPQKEVTFGPTQPINIAAQFIASHGPQNAPMKFEGPPSADIKEWPPQQIPGEEPNLTTVYPSNFKLRNEMPVQQERPPVVASQPAFKMTKPIKMRGDNKWPPANAGPGDTVQQEVREFVKPKKQCKDYSGFFAQNALSSNYTGYRAPPGTQHVGSSEEVEGTSEM